VELGLGRLRKRVAKKSIKRRGGGGGGERGRRKEEEEEEEVQRENKRMKEDESEKEGEEEGRLEQGPAKSGSVGRTRELGLGRRRKGGIPNTPLGRE
jgi:hypothetical protein